MRDHGATSTTAQTDPEPVLARHLAQALAQAATVSRAPAGSTSASCVPVCSASSTDLQPQLDDRCRQLGELRPERRPQPRAFRRRVSQRHRPSPRAPADELRAATASLRNGRPARSGRASSRSSSAPNARRSVSSFPTASGKESASTSSAQGGVRPHATPLAAARERPGLDARRPEPLRNSAPRQRGELTRLPHAEPFQLRIPVRLQRQQRRTGVARGIHAPPSLRR